MTGVIINIDSRMQCQESLRSQVERNPVSMVCQRGTFFGRVREMKKYPLAFRSFLPAGVAEILQESKIKKILEMLQPYPDVLRLIR